MSRATPDALVDFLPSREDVGPETTLLSNLQLRDWLAARVNARAPAAVIRFGDAEARLLAVHPNNDSMDDAIAKLERETGLTLRPKSVLELRALVASAFDGADVLGIRFRERFLPDHRAWMEKLVTLYCERVAAGRRAAILAPCLLSYNLIEELPGLLSGGPVSVVSCRDMRPVLEGEWGLGDVGVYQVPSQYSTRDVDGAYEATMHGEPIWPDAHARTHAELEVRERGEVFLVGAGLFGKDLCIRIRDEGGIAIDMGSALDSIAGKLTRGPERRAFELYADGIPLPEIAVRLQRLFDTPVDADMVVRGLGPALTDTDSRRRRPLDAVLCEIWLEPITVSIGEHGTEESRECCLAVGSDHSGSQLPVGIWWRSPNGTEPWPDAFADLRRRGLRDVPTVWINEPAEIEDALRATFPRAHARTATRPVEGRGDIHRAIAAHEPFPDEETAAKLITAAFGRAKTRSRQTRSPS